MPKSGSLIRNRNFVFGFLFFIFRLPIDRTDIFWLVYDLPVLKKKNRNFWLKIKEIKKRQWLSSSVAHQNRPGFPRAAVFCCCPGRPVTHTGTLGPPSASVCVYSTVEAHINKVYTHTLPPPSCKSTLLRDVFIPCFIIFILFFPGIFVTEREPGGPWLGIYLSRHNLSVPIFSPCLWGAFFCGSVELVIFIFCRRRLGYSSFSWCFFFIFQWENSHHALLGATWRPFCVCMCVCGERIIRA